MKVCGRHRYVKLLFALMVLGACKSETVVKHDISSLACPDPDKQYRDIDGYCVCDPEFGKYNPDTDKCEDCQITCDGKSCGPDGCGGSCGECEPGYGCNDGMCEPCEPFCDGVQCGSDMCGGSCGSCNGLDLCLSGQCVPCSRDCEGKTCGPDGCGAICGTCEENEACIGGSCESEDAGLECGAVITSCTCQTAPPGATPGATRFEATCDSKIVVISLCPGACTDPWGNFVGYPWQETCAC